MDAFTGLTRAELLVLVRQQQVVITELQAGNTRLEARVKELERRLEKGGPRGVPGTKMDPASPPADPPRPRKPRAQGAGRARSAPTEQIDHALEQCPDCGTTLGGGAVKRTREVLEIPSSPVRIIEHRYLERECPLCRKRFTPAVDLSEQVVGQQRLGVGLVSLIVCLREVGRLPVRTIQWMLETWYDVHLSVGTIATASQRVALVAEPAVLAVRDQIRASPVVHADETGWRIGGHNGYVWAFSTPQARYFLHGRRTMDMVDRVLGPDFEGVLTSDFYAAYDHYPGLKQRCWAHLLRDIHELRQIFPEDAALQTWGKAVHTLFVEARDTVWATAEQRQWAAADYQRRLLKLGEPFVDDPEAPQGKLCRRIVRYRGELFIFVAEPGVPPTNNAAERSVRPLVTRRKISGGSRSHAAAEATMDLASLFGTWQLQNQNPSTACRQLLAQS